MGRSNFLLGSIQPEHNKVEMAYPIQKANSANPLQFKGRVNLQQSGAGLVNPSSQVSAGNIGGPKATFDFKTVNQERIKWIQPQAINSMK